MIVDLSPEVKPNISTEIPDSLKFIVKKLPVLRDDYRDELARSLSGFLTVLGRPISEADILRTSSQLNSQTEVLRPRRLEELILDCQHLGLLIDGSSSTNPTLSRASQDLLASLNEAYIFPATRGVLYKATTSFWSGYLRSHPDQVVVPSEELIDYLRKYCESSLEATQQLGVDPIVYDYLEASIFPDIFEDFSKTANHAPKIKYFRNTDRHGKPKHLLFHQVEGIRIFEETKGGAILGDEPGTGKTMILALAPLAILDREQPTQSEPGRVLVVGSKTVCNNWEKELRMHLDIDEFDLVNMNFPTQGHGSLARLSQRLAKVDAALSHPNHNKQVVLVNYDVFRNPQFKAMVKQYDFTVGIVDEAHNIRTKFFESIQQEIDELVSRKRVAQRTAGLNSFLQNETKHNFLATSTPYVKGPQEPAIMMHLVSPDLVPASAVRELSEDPVSINRLLKTVMLRRRKEDITDLPPKETVLSPIDLSSMSPEDCAAFIKIAQEMIREGDGISTFYSLLALEGQVKYPWLIDTVKEKIAAGRKVIVFTPFTQGDAITGPVSTAAIAQRLRSEGVGDNVSILDGSILPSKRIQIQENFLRKSGVSVLVGSYATAGESITLNSAENRATEIIIFVAPNRLDHYINAINRVHRLGQEEQVTIHIPTLIGDLLKRAEGTYDERLIRRLLSEVADLDQVVDSLFFLEPPDMISSLAQQERYRFKPGVSLGQTVLPTDGNFALPTKEEVLKGRWQFGKGRRIVLDNNRRGPFRAREKNTVVMPTNILPREAVKPEELVNIQGIRARSTMLIYQEDQINTQDIWSAEALKHPVLTADQEQIIFTYYKEGRSLEELRENREFLAANTAIDQERLERILANSEDILEVIVRCNQRLVLNTAYRIYGLPLLDRVQEGNMGLLKAIEKFDHTRGFRFSTYATAWIGQAISKAVIDTTGIVRIPVHIHEGLSQVYSLGAQFRESEGRNPTYKELEALILANTDITPTAVANLIKTIRGGIMHIGSLDEELTTDSETTRGDLTGDSTVDVEEEALDGAAAALLAKLVEGELNDKLTQRQAQIIRMRFGLDDGKPKNLGEIGEELGVSRERVRQIEAEAIKKIRRISSLRKAHHGDETFPRREQRDSREIVALEVSYRPDVWATLSPIEQSLLTHIFLNESPPHQRQVIKRRLSRIFDMSYGQLEATIYSAIERAEKLLDQR